MSLENPNLMVGAIVGLLQRGTILLRREGKGKRKALEENFGRQMMQREFEDMTERS